MRLELNNQQGDAQLRGGWRVLARQKLLGVEQRMRRLASMKHIRKKHCVKISMLKRRSTCFNRPSSEKTQHREGGFKLWFIVEGRK